MKEGCRSKHFGYYYAYMAAFFALGVGYGFNGKQLFASVIIDWTDQGKEENK